MWRAVAWRPVPCFPRLAAFRPLAAVGFSVSMFVCALACRASLATTERRRTRRPQRPARRQCVSPLPFLAVCVTLHVGCVASVCGVPSPVLLPLPQRVTSPRLAFSSCCASLAKRHLARRLPSVVAPHFAVVGSSTLCTTPRCRRLCVAAPPFVTRRRSRFRTYLRRRGAEDGAQTTVASYCCRFPPPARRRPSYSPSSRIRRHTRRCFPFMSGSC